MSQNYDEIIEPRENDEQRAARENRLRALEEEAAQLRAVLADMEDKDENN